jgi:hypothetical protein
MKLYKTRVGKMDTRRQQHYRVHFILKPDINKTRYTYYIIISLASIIHYRTYYIHYTHHFFHKGKGKTKQKQK